MPAVSVIIPVYNGSAFIEEALQSVFAQTDVDLEVIVGDNASTDDTVALASKYSADKRLRILTSDKNLGIFGNLNRLVVDARAPLVKILCADDWILPGGLARQVAFMQSRPELGFSRCLGHQEVGPNLVNKGPYRYQKDLPEVVQPAAGALVFFTFGNIVGNLTDVIFRKQVFSDCGPFDQSYPYAGDMEMWCRVATKYAFGFQREALVGIRAHPGQCSVTLNKENELIAQSDRIMEGLFARLPAEHKALCRYHASVVVMVQQVSITLRRLMEGKWGAVRKIAGRRSFAYPVPVCVLCYLLTGGMRWGYHFSTRRLLGAIYSLNEKGLAG